MLKSGLPNDIKAFKKHGITNGGVRIDSGDITYLSKRIREVLDKEGLPDCRVVASNSLDEYIIRDLLLQGAQIDAFGVGERLITSKSDPVFGGVYKLCAVENADGSILPKIKISENPAKITTPHFKKVYRLFEKESGKAAADLLCVFDEVIDDTKPLTIFHPHYTWKEKTLTNFVAKELLVPVYQNGKLIYSCPTTAEIRSYCLEQIGLLWDEVKRFDNPHAYYVDLSRRLWEIKHDLLRQKSKG